MSSVTERDIQAVIRWLRSYSTHLERAIPGLAHGEPDEDWAAKRQEFDEQLREFDANVLHRLRDCDEVQDALLHLFETQGRFRKALGKGMAEVSHLRRSVNRGQKVLRSYSEAGDKLRSGALYVEKSY